MSDTTKDRRNMRWYKSHRHQFLIKIPIELFKQPFPSFDTSIFGNQLNTFCYEDIDRDGYVTITRFFYRRRPVKDYNFARAGMHRCHRIKTHDDGTISYCQAYQEKFKLGSESNKTFDDLDRETAWLFWSQYRWIHNNVFNAECNNDILDSIFQEFVSKSRSVFISANNKYISIVCYKVLVKDRHFRKLYNKIDVLQRFLKSKGIYGVTIRRVTSYRKPLVIGRC